MELPQYTLRPDINRMVVPWVFKLLGLSVLFYGGIYFNARFALDLEIPPLVNVFIFLLLVVLIIAQSFIYHIRFGKYQYRFFTDRIEFEGKKQRVFMFDQFQAADLKQGLFDRMFNTGIISIDKDFSIGPIGNPLQVKDYLEQLVDYYRASRQRVRAQQQQASFASAASVQNQDVVS